MHQIVRCFLKNSEWKYLLVKHKDKNHWVLPGWHIEKWEDIYKAIKREIMEELWIKIKIIWRKKWLELDWLKELHQPLITYKIEYTTKKGKDEKRLEYIFLAEIKESEIIRTQIEEIDEYKFFTKKEIIELPETYKQTNEIARLLD